MEGGAQFKDASEVKDVLINSYGALVCWGGGVVLGWEEVRRMKGLGRAKRGRGVRGGVGWGGQDRGSQTAVSS